MTDTCPTCDRPAAYGIEYAGVYDGTLVWACATGHQWPRFPEGRLHALAVKLIDG